MGDEWSAPIRPDQDGGWNQESETPYVHWWHTREADKLQGTTFDTLRVKFTPKQISEATLSLPIPDYARNDGDFGDFDIDDVLEQLGPDAIGDVPQDTVLIGIVDTGIPLSHRRSRTLLGETRFISSWQQNARYAGQDNLPFGQELYANHINDLMGRHSQPNLKGPLDEDEFNKAAGLSIPEARTGDRELDHRFSHGAHVLDLAAGYDPLFKTEDPIKNTRIISVNLPPQKVHGTAGNFLTIYAALAIERILLIANALWTAQHGESGPGFPLVINFSFGKNAGPKDGNSVWEKIIQDLIENRDAKSPTRLVMPVGNQNLSRGNARKLLSTGDTFWKGLRLEPHLEVPLMVHPADRTSNFVEVWAKAQRDDGAEEVAEVDEAKPSEFQLFVTAPGREKMEVRDLNVTGTYSDLGDYARVYCYSPFGQLRPHFVICVAPTESLDQINPSAPAGVWNLRLVYNGEKVQEATFGIQTDLSGIRDSKSGLRSYFDHPNYRTHLDTGRLRDSYVDSAVIPVEYPGGHCDPWPKYGPVQRKGSHNALASWPDNDDQNKAYFMVVGGYRINDNAPAIYSSTFDGDAKRELGRETPTALYPSDDTPSHYGLLAAGSKEGSVVALRGTSMAAGLATRDIARGFATRDRNHPEDRKIDEFWVKDRSEESQNVNGLKRGRGMVAYPGIGRIPRHGSG